MTYFRQIPASAVCVSECARVCVAPTVRAWGAAGPARPAPSARPTTTRPMIAGRRAGAGARPAAPLERNSRAGARSQGRAPMARRDTRLKLNDLAPSRARAFVGAGSVGAPRAATCHLGAAPCARLPAPRSARGARRFRFTSGARGLGPRPRAGGRALRHVHLAAGWPAPDATAAGAWARADARTGPIGQSAGSAGAQPPATSHLGAACFPSDDFQFAAAAWPDTRHCGRLSGGGAKRAPAKSAPRRRPAAQVRHQIGAELATGWAARRRQSDCAS